MSPAGGPDGRSEAGRPLRVVHVLISLEVGGLERGTVNLIRQSSGAFVHEVCCLRRTGPLAADLPPGVRVHDLGLVGGRDPRAFLKLRRLVRALRPDIVRGGNYESLLYTTAACVGTGVPAVYYKGGRTQPPSPRRHLVERTLSRRCRCVIVPSNDLRDYAVKVVGIPADRIRVIESGVDPSRFPLAPAPPAERERLGLPADARVIGTVGRLVPEKDHPTLLEAFLRVRQAVPAARLLIVGDGPLRSELEGRSRRLGLADSVSFLGSRGDVPALYRSMDLMVSTSRWEGLSNVLLEAMAAGVPVVATRVGGTSRVVEDGVTGFTADPGDASLIADRAVRLLTDSSLAARLREAAREKVLREFSISRMSREYESLYEAIITGRALPASSPARAT
jgi:glycosyltransferase involved in cell wall biosynthesis